MSAHLSSKQISQWMAGDRMPETERHLQECAHCVAEITRLETVLAGFRSSVIDWSAHPHNTEIRERLTRAKGGNQFTGRIMVRWKLAAAVLVVILAVPICININDRHRKEEALQADIRLWEEVNDQVSRTVPSSMEPLMNLIAWEPDSIEK